MALFKSNLNLKYILPLTVFLAGVATAAQSQVASGRATPASQGTMSVDTGFLDKNMRDNKMEIDLSQLALSKSGNDRVKGLAKQMVEDHTQILNDLSKIAQNNNMLALPGYPTNGTAMATADKGATASQNTTGNLSSGNTSQSRSVNADATQNGGDAGSRNTGSYNNLGTTGSSANAGNQRQGVNANAGHEAHMSSQDMQGLRSASGAEFDKLWISQMLAMHQSKLSELTTNLETINDSDLKTAVSQAIPKIKSHLDQLTALQDHGNH